LKKGESLVLPGEERKEEAESTVDTGAVHQQKACFSFLGVFKTYVRASPGGSHPIMNE
jgi:hypothetical protein